MFVSLNAFQVSNHLLNDLKISNPRVCNGQLAKWNENTVVSLATRTVEGDNMRKIQNDPAENFKKFLIRDPSRHLELGNAINEILDAMSKKRGRIPSSSSPPPPPPPPPAKKDFILCTNIEVQN